MDNVSGEGAIPMWELLNQAPDHPVVTTDEQRRQVRTEDAATLIYTSGTTGVSKGVILNHGNLTSNAVMSAGNYEWKPDDHYLSFLPLSHVTARHLDYVCFLRGVGITYCPAFEQLPGMLQT